jgi:hypothetical protein
MAFTGPCEKYGWGTSFGVQLHMGVVVSVERTTAGAETQRFLSVWQAPFRLFQTQCLIHLTQKIFDIKLVDANVMLLMNVVFVLVAVPVAQDIGALLISGRSQQATQSRT